ncbi:MAG: magnesium transporter, partial [Betaproteobacteria bacterium]|nr:magnesium transporter [Betaproteobacteria bacterium]
MSPDTRLETEDLQRHLGGIRQLLSERRDAPELRARLDALHPADIAYMLEALPPGERLALWDLVKADRDGEILVEVSEAVRESLIEAMDSKELVAAAETLEADELADIAADLPPGVIAEVVQALPAGERERLRAALSYPEGTVGALMDFDHVAVREDVTLEAVTRYLRRMDELPDHTDQLFVVDREQVLRGTLPLARLIVSDLELE